MSLIELQDIGGYLAFDEAQCRNAGRALHNRYVSASPFPHIVLEDFLDWEVLRQVAHSYPQSDGKAFFDRDQERLKFQYLPQESSSPLVRNLLPRRPGHSRRARLIRQLRAGGARVIHGQRNPSAMKRQKCPR